MWCTDSAIYIFGGLGATHLENDVEELDSYFYVPLDFLAEPANLVLDRFEYGGRERLVPRYEWEEHSIWGITAAILVKLVNMSCDAGIHLEDYWRGSTP